ncbi:protocatechuate 3,4-dioxygenase subunit alpha [Aerococcus sanguinicola]|uniref:Protocatechuate 3,4-dioxygenase subunit alpha n=1 Tax=Aerococcus sanguinicola TaxID=119206 RepID=A0A109RDK8_9LACT|nr:MULTISPECIES: protocatechuate 3,4-dioxygenase subunit alpha [Aerococcus]AMB94373.1 hypothetical protein AWM72_06165 [Aerococcus sanguinicola]MDK7049840.1 protocatechuate 3,4-dioxygenase subunit alpha [Aerococcus sanguinicola]OFT93460.1 hypothetical protein HMPREF3090_06800 [Aerococcus sp. HMSC23C02]PKZ20696.1 protocatechuate 3,4-dioxygenase subunit alpha [Aerococcus sanguinicola]
MTKLDQEHLDPIRTPQQTVGPYASLGLVADEANDHITNDLVEDGGQGQEIILQGNLFGSDGKPLFNVLVEIWQANSEGVFNHPAFKDREGYDPSFVGFGRTITDERGAYSFRTFKPGAILENDYPEFSQSPHILAFVHASGVSYPLYTRIYFEDESQDDHFIQQVSEEEAKTLIAKKVEGTDLPTYQFDIVLDGDAEDMVLESKLGGEEVDDLPDGSGKAKTYFFHFK